MLMVAVAISTAVSAQRPLRKVIVETSSSELFSFGAIVTDSFYREYTPCEKFAWAGIVDTSAMFMEYTYDHYDTLTYAYASPERYVFNLRKGVVTYSNGTTRKKTKMSGFSYSGPYKFFEDFVSEGYIMVYTDNEKGQTESYSLYFDMNTLSYSPGSEPLSDFAFNRKEYKISRVIRK